MKFFKNIHVIRTLSLFGIIGAVFYFAHVIFGRIFYEGYNPFSQAISDLTAISSPSRNIASFFSFLYGIFTVIFSISFLLYFKSKINKIAALGALFFCVMNLVSFLGYMFFPLTESGFANTFQDKMHMVVTVLVVLFTVIAIIFYSIGFLKTSNYKYMGIISLCTFAALLIGVILINNLPKEYFGIAERINVYSIIIFTGILSLWMFNFIRIRMMDKK